MSQLTDARMRRPRWRRSNPTTAGPPFPGARQLGGVGQAAFRVHFWFAPPVHVQIWAGVPSAELLP